MTDFTKPVGFITCMKDFFGNKPGSTSMMDFAQEIRALDERDRQFYIEQLEQQGYKVQKAA